ncbi:hypothetical protein MF621_004009 (plasmid) [Bacillus velezensis]|uniref:hypothetical protein n=1 Tax=Bacillus velezensis TaxID=492670 RepID=UPI0020258F46|nr:hypothetical protein [Bacillus velezensis]URJ76468.1 hypothetical protein MF619_004047 [Bacillus velezensis]URJ80424.1 hypothetical protein MF621_004009 [Bacillus velezensis]
MKNYEVIAHFTDGLITTINNNIVSENPIDAVSIAKNRISAFGQAEIEQYTVKVKDGSCKVYAVMFNGEKILSHRYEARTEKGNLLVIYNADNLASLYNGVISDFAKKSIWDKLASSMEIDNKEEIQIEGLLWANVSCLYDVDQDESYLHIYVTDDTMANDVKNISAVPYRNDSEETI